MGGARRVGGGVTACCGGGGSGQVDDGPIAVARCDGIVAGQVPRARVAEDDVPASCDPDADAVVGTVVVLDAAILRIAADAAEIVESSVGGAIVEACGAVTADEDAFQTAESDIAVLDSGPTSDNDADGSVVADQAVTDKAPEACVNASDEVVGRHAALDDGAVAGDDPGSAQVGHRTIGDGAG